MLITSNLSLDLFCKDYIALPEPTLPPYPTQDHYDCTSFYKFYSKGKVFQQNCFFKFVNICLKCLLFQNGVILKTKLFYIIKKLQLLAFY